MENKEMKKELLERLEKWLQDRICDWSLTSNDDIEQIVADATEDAKDDLLDESYFEEIQADRELINVSKNKHPAAWDYQRQIIKNWCKTSVGEIKELLEENDKQN